jgi:hypothetical protein
MSPSVCLNFGRFCSARLQAGILESNRCSSAAADERYKVRYCARALPMSFGVER